MLRLVACCLVLGLLAGCGDDPLSDSECAVGEKRACSCPGGATGTQVCLGEGGFDVCDCRNATCADGHHDGGDGACVEIGTCSVGHRDGGAGSCVAIGTCSAGYHDGGAGTCVATGTCSDGYHDGGNGACVATGTCWDGYHDGGNGACVAIGTCSEGHHDGGAGACVAIGTCSEGRHDGGAGACVAIGTCSDGHHDGGAGSCVAIGNCSDGHHDGGDGACVETGTCSAGHRDGGFGVCVTDGTCLTGFRDSGVGTCVRECEPGEHDNGVGTCVPSGCADGYHDNGLGLCVLSGCASGYQANGAGACVFDAVGVSAGDQHTCAITAAGGVKCWGDNFEGRLGDGTTLRRSSAVDVSGLTSGVAVVAVGSAHTCAITTAGGVRCWGNNLNGQLGDGTTTNRHAPVDVSGLASGVAAVSAGFRHTCAVTTAGGVKCWGANHRGQLGDGTTTNQLTPVDAAGLGSGAAAVTAGADRSCALTTAGGVKCWGDNRNGQLGDGTTTPRATPLDVVGLTSGVAAVEAGGTNTCAVTTAGGVKCWGANSKGQLGDGTTTDRYTPVDVTGLTTGVAVVSARLFHTCALTTTSGVKCWGENYYGQLGDGTRTDRLTPVDIGPGD